MYSLRELEHCSKRGEKSNVHAGKLREGHAQSKSGRDVRRQSSAWLRVGELLHGQPLQCDSAVATPNAHEHEARIRAW